MAEVNHEIRTLNTLIANTFDSINAYTATAAQAKARRLGEIFRARASERGMVVRSLQAEVSRLGGSPEEQGTFLAGLPRNFRSLERVVASNNPRAIFEEVERGEDQIEAKFESALADDGLSVPVKAVIRTGFASVCEGHDRMRDLKRQLETAD